MCSPHTFELVGAPFDLAANAGGSAAAPAALRSAGLALRISRLPTWGIQLVDGGDVVTESPACEPTGTDVLVHLRILCERLLDRITDVHASGRVPLVIGGDHSVAIGTVAAAATEVRRRTNDAGRLGLLWVDAHADANDREQGNLHGKPVAVSLARCHPQLAAIGGFAPKLHAQDIVYVAVRDLMPNERPVLDAGARLYSMTEIDQRGLATVVTEAIADLEARCDGFLLSFDVDACDASVFPACAAPETGGLTAREANAVFRLAGESPRLLGVDIVEYVPDRDADRMGARLIVSLIDALVGWRITSSRPRQ